MDRRNSPTRVIITKREELEIIKAGQHLLIDKIPPISFQNINDPVQRARKWYYRMGCPTRSEMKARIERNGSYYHDVTVDDIDHLPWNDSKKTEWCYEREDLQFEPVCERDVLGQKEEMEARLKKQQALTEENERKRREKKQAERDRRKEEQKRIKAKMERLRREKEERERQRRKAEEEEKEKERLRKEAEVVAAAERRRQKEEEEKKRKLKEAQEAAERKQREEQEAKRLREEEEAAAKLRREEEEEEQMQIEMQELECNLRHAEQVAKRLREEEENEAAERQRKAIKEEEALLLREKKQREEEEAKRLLRFEDTLTRCFDDAVLSNYDGLKKRQFLYDTRMLMAYQWWYRMQYPLKKDMIRRCRKSDMERADLYPRDIELLPWLEGFSVDVPQMIQWIETLDPKVVEVVDRLMYE